MFKIESIIKRTPPTQVTLGDTSYQFEPDAEGRHVCLVEDQAHLAKFLAIPEGYRLIVDHAPVIKAAEPVVNPVITAQGLHVQETDGTIKPLKEVEEETLAAIAQAAGVETEGTAEQIASAINEVVNTEQPDDAPVTQETSGEPDIEELRALYFEKFGAKPHHKWKAERIQQEINKG